MCDEKIWIIYVVSLIVILIDIMKKIIYVVSLIVILIDIMKKIRFCYLTITSSS